MTGSRDPHRRWLQRFVALLHAELPAPQSPRTRGRAARRVAAGPGAPCCLMLSPHPDDECIVGALALRLRREAGWRVVNGAVTLGSRRERRAARLAELHAACAQLDFEIVLPAPDGLERVTLAARRDDPDGWRAKVAAIVRWLHAVRPALVLLPHAGDASGTHAGVHALGYEAIERAGLPLTAAFTEYWGTLPDPNLLVESSLDDVVSLVRALSCHVGEIARNPYHLRLPAWMADAVRRGGELVLGAGSVPPAIDFATLYRLQTFSGDAWLSAPRGQVLLAGTPLSPVGIGVAD